VYIGFKNHVCINMRISTDGFLDDLKVMTVPEIFNRVFQLLTRFDAEKQVNHLKTLSEYALTERQFASLIGRLRMYPFLKPEQKASIPIFQLGDSQVNNIIRDYYQDKSFCRDDAGNINLWRLNNLFTGANKSNYIDSFLNRSVGVSSFVGGLQNALKEGSQHWFLS
jgi:hypothetical protein